MTIDLANNLTSDNIIAYMNNTSQQLNQSMERLSTGYKINHASDGSADMAIITNLTSQLNGYGTASTDTQLGLSTLQTADSALQQINSHLQNIRDIAVAASNSTTTSAQYASYQSQLQSELGSIDSIVKNTKDASNNTLLDGSIASGSGFNIQIGPNSGDSVDIKSAFTNNSSGTGGLNVTQNTLTSTSDASTLLTQVDAAISTVSSNLSTVGGFESRFTDQLSYLSTAQTNISASISSIRDTDVAAETANLTRLQTLQQAQAYTLAQANTLPSIALTLLK